MSMSRKDFQMFADAFGKVFYSTLDDLDVSEGVSLTLKAFMDVCEEINPRFDRERFKDRIKAGIGVEAE
jgi:hypothetical protein